jgi:hypothetical protein
MPQQLSLPPKLWGRQMHRSIIEMELARETLLHSNSNFSPPIFFNSEPFIYFRKRSIERPAVPKRTHTHWIGDAAYKKCNVAVLNVVVQRSCIFHWPDCAAVTKLLNGVRVRKRYRLITAAYWKKKLVVMTTKNVTWSNNGGVVISRSSSWGNYWTLEAG